MSTSVVSAPLTSYLTSTWTTAFTAGSDSVITSIVVSITGSTATNVQIRKASSGGSDLAVIATETLLANNTSYEALLKPIGVLSGELIEVWADQSGVEFLVSGASF